jgi:hypothetical protein
MTRYEENMNPSRTAVRAVTRLYDSHSFDGHHCCSRALALRAWSCGTRCIANDILLEFADDVFSVSEEHFSHGRKEILSS